MEHTHARRAFPRVLRRLDATLFTVCAILVIDQLAAAASIGTSAIFWWVFTLLLFFIPYALISAELGAAYPEEGGIYAWVRRAYGPRWGARASWLYWVNVALWMPSVYVLFAGMFAQMFAPELSLWAKIGIGIVLTWVTVYINVISLNVGKWVPNAGAVVKAAIMLSIGIGGVVYATGHGVANDFSLQGLAPSWQAGLAFLPVIVYNFMGFELMSGASEEMTDPQRDVPRAIIISGVLIATFYLLATVGMLIALPVDQIGLIEGLLDALHGIFDGYAWGAAFVTMLGIGALFTFLANMVTWTIGANRSASEAAERGDLPAVFGKLHPHHRTPANAAIVTGVVSTAVIVLYGLLASSAEDLFWTIFAFSSIVFLLPYLLMFGAFLVLRRKDAHRPRPYRVPGGTTTARVLVGLCMVFILQAIVLFVWVPGSEFDRTAALAIVGGVLATIVVGEVLIRRTGAATRSQPGTGPAQEAT
ncbi:MAG TPA: APC family permease [Steroidobacteraceae bacterium]|nr:APC family permease [Steroidobacteraceae bacterium]